MRRLMDIEQDYMNLPYTRFYVGDTVDVGVKITEVDLKASKGSKKGIEEKERIQIFNGTVIRFQGHGPRRNFTVRRIVAGDGVERTFPLFSPRIASVEVKRQGKVRRARLYYLRDRVGKATKVLERMGDSLRKPEPVATRPAENKVESTEA